MLGGKGQLIALLGQFGEFIVSAEVSGIHLEGFRPAFDAGAEGGIDILERLFGGSGRGRIAGFTDSVENAAGFGLFFGLEAKEGILEGDMGIGMVEAHGLAELVAGGLGLADFEQGVGKVLTNGGSSRGSGDGLVEEGDSLVVILGAKKLIGSG